MKATMKTKDLLAGMKAIGSFVPKGEAVRLIEHDGDICINGADNSHVIAVCVYIPAKITQDEGTSSIVIPYGHIMRSVGLLSSSVTCNAYSHGIDFVDDEDNQVAHFSTKNESVWGESENKTGKIFTNIEKATPTTIFVRTEFLKAVTKSAMGVYDSLKFNIQNERLVVSRGSMGEMFSMRSSIGLVSKDQTGSSIFPIEFLLDTFKNIPSGAAMIKLGIDTSMLLTVLESELKIIYGIAPWLGSE